MASPKGSFWSSSLSISFCMDSTDGALPVWIRLPWAGSKRATPSKTAGLLIRMVYTCLLIVRLALAAYIPGTSVRKPMSSLMKAWRLMENWRP